MIRMLFATSTQAVALDLSGLATVLSVVLALGVIVLMVLLWRSASSSDPHVFESDDERRERAAAGRERVSIDG